MRSMASANMGATVRYLILALAPSGMAGMVSRRASSEMTLALMRSMAGPERTPWLAQAWTDLAWPTSMTALAALQREPPVSTISSKRMQSLPSTSPMMFMTSHWLAFWRRLSTMARFIWSFWAKVRARATEPTSGETTTMSSQAEPNFLA